MNEAVQKRRKNKKMLRMSKKILKTNPKQKEKSDPIDSENASVSSDETMEDNDDEDVIYTYERQCLCACVFVCVCLRCPDESIALTVMKFGTQVVVIVTE
ncbi:hypothetical protein AVEN_194869-1 [Araneus ventricosus]|uniref:Uncharacterized protein n=1 Tax=Araneus ventricosus TaxID=182803 RepID=A0A4Y2B5P5_ARAVE|nr:hypothetical protein AVEN_194869-1 [Araneus ventricosus]